MEVNEKQNFGFTGNVQTFTIPNSGEYLLEVWGAEGGRRSTSIYGGKGGYSKGYRIFEKGEVVKVFVGGDGGAGRGYNGGGKSAYSGVFGGGGTDIRSNVAFYWYFKYGLEGFTNGNVGISQANGNLLVSKTNGDYHFISPTIRHAGQAGDVIEICMKNNSVNKYCQIFYSANGGGYNETDSTSLNVSTNDSDFKVHRFEVGRTGRWNGATIHQLRLDIANGGGVGTVEIKYIKIITPTNDYNTNRFIIAGGGGSVGAPSKPGGAGGGLNGESRNESYGSGGGGGTQTTGGAGGNNNSGGYWSGGDGQTRSGGYGGAGGGGYFGGGGVYPDSSGDDDRGGGGGSGMIIGVCGGQSIIGNTSLPNPNGGNQTGHSGHGYARLTLIDKYPEPMFINVNGTHRNCEGFININGVWKPFEPFNNVNNVWKS